MTTAPDWAETAAREVVNRGGFDSPDDLVNAIAADLREQLRDAHGCIEFMETNGKALRAENDHLKSVNEKGLAELAKLREQVRLAVEARKAYRDAWVRQQSTDCEPIGIVPEVRAPSVGAELADSALRAAGVEI